MSTKSRLRAPSITCLLCDGLVAYTRADRQRFDSHMKVEHGASANLSYLLAGCLMSKEERNVVSAIIEEREESKVDAVLVEQVEYAETRDKEVGEVEIPKKAKPVPEVPEEIQNTDNEIQEIENEILLYGGVGREKESHPCDHCEKTFAKSQSLWLHQKKMHKGRKREESSVKSQDSGAKKVKLNEETKAEFEEENIEEMVDTAADLEAFNLDEEKEERAENEKKSRKVEEKEKGKTVKSKRRGARKGENSTRSVEDTLASSDEKMEVGEIFETNDETGQLGNKEDKKRSKEPVFQESESEKKMMSKESVVKESEYFSVHTQDITNYKKRDDEELKTMDYLPPGWFCIERVLASGRKILTFVNPDLTISFRSKVAVFEFIKFLGVYSSQDLEVLAKTMSIKAK